MVAITMLDGRTTAQSVVSEGGASPPPAVRSARADFADCTHEGSLRLRARGEVLSNQKRGPLGLSAREPAPESERGLDPCRDLQRVFVVAIAADDLEAERQAARPEARRHVHRRKPGLRP